MTPQERSRKLLRDEGWTIATVEKWKPASPGGFRGPLLREDLWGFGDLIAVKVGHIGATLIQVTTGSNSAARLEKIKGIAEAGIWIAAGNRIVVHSWAKRGPRGKRKTWTCNVIQADYERSEI